MATVGNTASLQVNMAQIQTKYGTQLDSLKNSGKLKRYGYSASAETLDSLLNSNALKNKSTEFKDQYSALYKSIYGITDESSDESSTSTAQSIKAASANAGGSAESIKSFANSLKYGGEVDLDAYKAQAQDFVDNYNALVEKVGNSDNNSVLQKGVLMVNSTKVYTSSLNRAGISVGSDNKLTLNSDLSGVSATDIKSTFGTNGYSDKIIDKSRQINNLTGGSGLFTVNKVTSSTTESTEKTDNSGTLKELTAAVKDAATALKTYSNNLGSEESSFSATDFTETAKTFIEKYNSFLVETANSDKSGINSKGVALNNVTNSYKYALERAGVNIGSDGKLSLSDDLSKVTDKDVKYAFGYGSYLDKVNQKADQVNSLAGSASALSYSSNSNLNYIYSTGALMNIYA